MQATLIVSTKKAFGLALGRTTNVSGRTLSNGMRTGMGEFRETSLLEFARRLFITIAKVEWCSSS
jgi:hypothetical protein